MQKNTAEQEKMENQIVTLSSFDRAFEVQENKRELLIR
jgi:hypothetical protein